MWRKLGAALAQFALVACLMGLVASVVGFDVFSRLAGGYLRALAASLGTDTRTALALSAWVSVLIGAFWVFDLAPPRRREARGAWLASRRVWHWLGFAAGWVLVGLGAVALVTLRDQGP